ncbi:hypothetical protein [Terracoccus luteus]|uniref:MOSC domain-containing protein n=1 Tax=Terracoccus luteus TaxID=53356 RepID=A0A839Q691_9MICO|nr:hypothetical protein [Terracoccus luteus]MBB2988161.1 hypothetical protein [Terracoccus luteus]MCP2173796.1 hypothetical protein [Terracoccus luteus]
MIATVSSLFIYPDSDAPGQQLDRVEMTETGPEGNRSKKHAVHLVTAGQYVREHPKANVVLDMDDSMLDKLVGRVVRMGEATLSVTRKPAQCAGVYAEVVSPGPVAVDDVLLVGDDESGDGAGEAATGRPPTGEPADGPA